MKAKCSDAQNLKAKTLESLSSVMPITAIVLLLSFTLAPEMPVGTLVMFLLGAFCSLWAWGCSLWAPIWR